MHMNKKNKKKKHQKSQNQLKMNSTEGGGAVHTEAKPPVSDRQRKRGAWSE